MVTFKALLHADLGKLQAAADEWKLLPKKYHGLQEIFEARVTKSLKSSWTGEAAEEAQKSLAKIKEQYQAAAEEAQAIATLLNDAHAEFSSTQKKLRRIIDEEAPSEHLDVLGDGTVVDVKELPDDYLGPSYMRPDQEERDAAVNKMKQRIAKVLREATEADEAANWAMGQDPNGKNNDSFNKKIYTSLDAARSAQKDMSEALRLAKKGGEDLSNDELARLGSILSKRKSDMVFAEKFALSMGPKGALEFWREASGPASGALGPERTTALKNLQSGLGATIGMATQSDSTAMDGWKEKMLALGPQTINPGSAGGPFAKGYQLMSSLMRGGGYETDFLHDYGRGLLSYERSHKSTAPQQLWAPDSVMPRVDYLGGGGGSDPVKGFMDALAKTPEAATQFLDPGVNNEDDRLKYLAGEREWPKDPLDHKSGHHSLALAIEAGATGPGFTAYGAHDHTEAQSRVMRDAVNSLGGETPSAADRLKDEQLRPYKPMLSDMREPMARVLRDYAPDTHNVLSDSSQPMAVRPDAGALIRTIRGVSEDPDAFRMIREAETKHIAHQLAELPPDVDEQKLKGTIGNASTALGAIDTVQSDVILDHRDDEISKKAWQAKAGYHVLAAGATKIPVVGDVAVRILDSGAKAWQDSATTDIQVDADGRIEGNVRAGHESVNRMIAKWYSEHGGSPEGLEVDYARHEGSAFYNSGRDGAALALGRGVDKT
ncbi:hypothetical protein T261_7033 [Streptomyces lydicus]|nr:hypothetical protein T261_7033 [Streptomyces lydicus]